MQLNGKSVEHKTFGSGIITDMAGSTVTIRFSRGEKKFVYPEAFTAFLTLKDRGTQKKLDLILDEKREAEAARRRAAAAADERLQRMRTLRIAPTSQAAFDIRAAELEETLRYFTLRTGIYLSGESKGQPRVPEKLRPNSACLLTSLKDGAPEKDRLISGVFMVQEDFFGDLCSDGLISAHETHRLALPGSGLRFWDYFSEGAQQRWGRIPFKYFKNDTMKRILFDIKNSVSAEFRDAAEELYRYFCRINQFPTLSRP